MDTDVICRSPSRRFASPLVVVVYLALAAAPASAQQQPASAPTLTAAASTTAARADVSLMVQAGAAGAGAAARRIVITLPDGLLARLTEVPFCPEPAVERGACPAASSLGTVRMALDTPQGPVALQGGLSLAGPTHGAVARIVLSLRAGAVRAGARMVEQASVTLGARDGRIRLALPVPPTIGGVAVRLRRVTLAITRAGFLFNPSGCTGRTVGARLVRADGSAATTAVPYPVSGCDALAFEPRVAIFNDDRDTFRRDSRPPLVVDLRPRAQDSSMRDVEIAFPKHLAPNIDLLKTVCNRPAAVAGTCPPATRIASARATSPLIPGPLEGPVHITYPPSPANTGAGIDVARTAVMLRGLGGLVQLRLFGALRLSSGRLVSSFEGLPDVPLTSFALRLRAGNFIATRSLCSPRFEHARARLVAHDGQVRSFRPQVEWAACQRRPLARATVARLRSLRPTVRLRIAKAPRGARLRRVNVALPERLRVRGAARGRVVVRADGRKVARRNWALDRSRKRLRIDGGLGRRGARRIRVVLRDGAVVAGERTRERARRDSVALRFVVVARETDGAVTTRRAYGYDEAWQSPIA